MALVRTVPALALALFFSAFGCSSSGGNEGRAEETMEGEAAGTDEAAYRTPVDFYEFSDDVGSAADNEARKLFTSEQAYENFFGHAPPSDVDFYYDWVIFYSAGTQYSGGYHASIEKLEMNGSKLYMTTRLESPADSCVTSQQETTPYTLIRFEKPYPRPKSLRFTRHDATIGCDDNPPPPPPPTCATILCASSTHCEEADDGAHCVADPPPCPGAGTRRTMQSACECLTEGLCTLGTSWNPSPSVCACE